jgi:cyclase
MHKKRLIARLDVKNQFVIKGIHLEGLRKIGDPNEIAKDYYDQGIDEIVFMDGVASLYGRNNLFHIIEKACENVFIPITIGGGIRSIENIGEALKAGADKIALNTQAIKTPEIVSQAAKIYGSQCIVGSIEAKSKGDGKWEAYTDNGREPSGLDVIEWAVELERLGAGELMITSIDQEGTKKGFEIDLFKKITDLVSIPVIASGGAGKVEHIEQLVENTDVSGIALASILHYKLDTISSIKNRINSKNSTFRK